MYKQGTTFRQNLYRLNQNWTQDRFDCPGPNIFSFGCTNVKFFSNQEEYEMNDDISDVSSDGFSEEW